MVAPDRNKLRRAFHVGKEHVGKEREGSARSPSRGDVRSFLRSRAERLAGPCSRQPRQRVELPPGEEIVNRYGAFWRRELRYPAEFVHGNVPLRAVRNLDGERLAELAKSSEFADVCATQCLFLDTETTGLSGGAGTVVFNYGLAFFRGDEFVVEQLFLRDFGEELAMLHHVAGRLWQFPVPVTFVGKSYDRHRIATRMTLHKVASPVLTAPHLDLYYLARRAFGAVLPDTRLRTVEEHLLGVHRADDLPGSEAPAAFFDWIRDQTGPVDRVLEHNRIDVLSLCTLLAVLAGRDRQL